MSLLRDVADTEPELINLVWSKLVQLDELHNIQSCARDIASLACSSRWLKQAARTKLWPQLGEGFKPQNADDYLAILRSSDHYEHQLGTKLRRLDPLNPYKTLVKAYLQAVPGYVPTYIFHETARLKGLGMASSGAKREFLLTNTDLEDIPYVERRRGVHGKTRLYRLLDLLTVARCKHGSGHGLRMAKAAKVEEAERRKRAAKEALCKRKQELVEALEQLGLELNETMLDVEPVQQYIRAKNAKGTLASLVQLLQLIKFCQENANYDKLHKDAKEERWRFLKRQAEEEVEQEGWSSYPYAGYYMSLEEEQDFCHLVLQRWVHKKGGKRVALRRPEVAAALRDRIASALEQPLRTDAKHWANWKEKGAGAGAAAADGVQADQANTEQGQGQQVAMEEEEDGWGASDRDSEDYQGGRLSCSIM